MKSSVNISPKAILGANLIIILILVIAHLIFGSGTYGTGKTAEWARFFSLDWEENLPTLFSAASLLYGSILAISISLIQEIRRKGRLIWASIGVVLLALCIDDWEMIHERVDGDIQGFISSFSPIPLPGIGESWEFFFLFVLIVALLLYSNFTLNLPKQIRNLIVMSFLMFAVGSVALEIMVHDILGISANPLDPLYFFFCTIEETFELSSVAIFNYALLKHLLSYRSIVISLPTSENIH